MKFFYLYQAIFMPSHVNMVRYDINNRFRYYGYYKVHHINHKLMNGFLRVRLNGTLRHLKAWPFYARVGKEHKGT